VKLLHTALDLLVYSKTNKYRNEQRYIMTNISLELDCLIAAHEMQPDTKAQRCAWDWLATLTSVTMQDGVYLIPSAKLSGVVYLSTAETCNCPAFSHGLLCWHRRASITLDVARENAAIEHAACREEFEPVYIAGISGVALACHAARHEEAIAAYTEVAHARTLDDFKTRGRRTTLRYKAACVMCGTEVARGSEALLHEGKALCLSCAWPNSNEQEARAERRAVAMREVDELWA
jgi:hypothetical protein